MRRAWATMRHAAWRRSLRHALNVTGGASSASASEAVHMLRVLTQPIRLPRWLGPNHSAAASGPIVRALHAARRLDLAVIARRSHRLDVGAMDAGTAAATRASPSFSWASRSFTTTRSGASMFDTFKGYLGLGGKPEEYEIPEGFSMDDLAALCERLKEQGQQSPLDMLNLDLDQIKAVVAAMTAEEKKLPGMLTPQQWSKVAKRVGRPSRPTPSSARDGDVARAHHGPVDDLKPRASPFCVVVTCCLAGGERARTHRRRRLAHVPRAGWGRSGTSRRRTCGI